jgi:hypothetical protein
MRTLILLACTEMLAPLAAQQPAKSPAPLPTGSDIKTAAAPAPAKTDAHPAIPLQASPDRRRAKTAAAPAAAPGTAPVARGLQYDDAGGSLWVLGETYKACFGGDGATFVPYFAGAPRNFPLRFSVRSAAVGGTALSLAAAPPQRRGALVTFEHGALRAEYELAERSLEQRFVFERLPARGEVRVAVDVATELAATRDGAGFVFGNELGDVTFGAAVALDAAGRRLPIATELEHGVMTFVVPAAFVESARLPLVIDPVVGSTQLVYSNSQSHPAVGSDVAYEPSWGEYCVVVDRQWSLTDHDVFAYRYTFDLSSAVQTTIDVSGACWAEPAVAANNAYDCFLVVAQTSAANSSPFSISGRVLGAGSGTIGAPFDIENPTLPGHFTGDKLHPSVGGDMDYQTPTYFTVVWERVFSPTDHDVHLKQVRADGTLRTVSPILIDNSGSYDSTPRISRTNGTPPYATQCWAIAWLREAALGDNDVYGALVRWDGVVTQPTFGIDAALATAYAPVPSSPTDERDGRRRYLVAFEDYAASTTEVRGTLIDDQSAFLGTWTLTANVNPGWPHFQPAVDSDGARFAVAFTEPYQLTSDYDVGVLTFGWNSALGLVEQDLAYPGYTTDQEYAPRITATHAEGSGTARYAMSWTRYDLTAPNDTHVDIRLYDGMAAAGGVSTRPTNCGSNATSFFLGTPAIGGVLYFQHANPGGLRGFVFGIPASAPIGPCPGCTLGVAGSAVLGDFLRIEVPADPTFVGVTVSSQSFSFVQGPCLGTISLDETIDVQLR